LLARSVACKFPSPLVQSIRRGRGKSRLERLLVPGSSLCRSVQRRPEPPLTYPLTEHFWPDKLMFALSVPYRGARFALHQGRDSYISEHIKTAGTRRKVLKKLPQKWRRGHGSALAFWTWETENVGAGDTHAMQANLSGGASYGVIKMFASCAFGRSVGRTT